jgi:hypothetical protein
MIPMTYELGEITARYDRVVHLGIESESARE